MHIIINGDKMQISARNAIKGKVVKVDVGAVNATIKIEVESPHTITATITKESVEELKITEGEEVMAIIKSSEVMVAKK